MDARSPERGECPLKPWDVPVVDDVVFTEEELNASMEKHPAEHYSKAGHLFNLHSWAPLYYSPDRLMENSTLDAQFGATLISQNLLGTTEASLGYGYTLDGHSTVRGRFAYYGWAPKIEVTALWSDHPHQTINTASNPFYTSYYKGNSFDLSVRAYLPLLLSSGYRIRSLVPTLQFNLDNTEIITPKGSRTGHRSYSPPYSTTNTSARPASTCSRAGVIRSVPARSAIRSASCSPPHGACTDASTPPVSSFTTA